MRSISINSLVLAILLSTGMVMSGCLDAECKHAQMTRLDLTTATRKWAESTNSIDIKICQEGGPDAELYGECCTTGILPGEYKKGEITQFTGFPALRSCYYYTLDTSKSISLTITSNVADKWKGEAISIRGWYSDIPDQLMFDCVKRVEVKYGGKVEVAHVECQPLKECGVLDEASRIINGEEAEANSIPWQVAMVTPGATDPNCGGTIISSRYVMTAAHCTRSLEGNDVVDIQPDGIEILAGEHDTLDNTDDATRHSVTAITYHPKYNMTNLDYDFSILKLDPPIDLTVGSRACAACLPDNGDTDFDSETEFVVSGWGRLQTGDFPNVLHHVSVPWISESDCNNFYHDIRKWHICAGDFEDEDGEGGVGSCVGDSGGPLTWLDPSTSRVKLIGVVSFGAGTCPGPGGYAKVTEVLLWVKGIIGFI